MRQEVFLDKIGKYVERANVPKAVLSNALSINVKTFDRGFRFLVNDSEKYKTLCTFLSLTADEREELDSLYIRTQFSDDVLSLIASVSSLLSVFNSYDIPSSGSSERIAQDSPIYGLIHNIDSWTDDGGEKRFVDIILYDMSSEILESIPYIIENNENVIVRLIIPLKDNGSIENSIEIIKKMCAIVPLMKYPANVILRYIYDNDDSDCGSLRNLLVTDSFAYLTDDDGKKRAVYRESLIVNKMRVQFEKVFRISSKLVGYADLQTYLDNYAADRLDVKKDYYAFQPCFSVYSFITPELIKKYLRSDIENRETIIQSLIGHFMVDNSSRARMHTFFSFDGMSEFMRTGENIDMPPEYCYPMEMSDRIEILKTIVNQIETSPFNSDILLKQSVIWRSQVNRSAIYCIDESVRIKYKHPKYANVYIDINEKHFVEAVRVFFKHLEKGRLTYSKKEALNCIINFVDELIRSE